MSLFQETFYTHCGTIQCHRLQYRYTHFLLLLHQMIHRLTNHTLFDTIHLHVIFGESEDWCCRRSADDPYSVWLLFCPQYLIVNDSDYFAGMNTLTVPCMIRIVDSWYLTCDWSWNTTLFSLSISLCFWNNVSCNPLHWRSFYSDEICDYQYPDWISESGWPTSSSCFFMCTTPGYGQRIFSASATFCSSS